MGRLQPRLLATTVFAHVVATGSVAVAQEVYLGEIVVTPNRTLTDKNKVGSKVDVVSKEEIDKQSRLLLTDYLTLVPGVHVAMPGGTGQESSLSVRGADKKYVKTIFNGIDISDPTSTQVQTPYQNLLVGGVGQIEVLKGSQSTLYGSDAIAGVIGVSTLAGIEAGVHHEISGEAGSFGTWRGGYSLTGADDTGRAAFNIFGLSTKGISAASVNGFPPVDLNPTGLEKDGFRDVNINFAGEKQINEYLSVFGSALYINARGDYDDAGNPPRDNEFNTFATRQRAARAGFNLDLLDGRLKNAFSFQASDIDRDLNSESTFGPFDGNFYGVRTKADYQGSYEATDWLTLQYGGDYERQSAHTTDNYGTDTKADFTLGGVWGQAILNPFENLTLTAGIRHDEHSEFGGYSTYRLTGSYLFADTGTRIHSSFGTGYRAPSLFELYDSYTGNPDLRPEQSQSFDVGVEQSFLDGRLVADATYFLLNTDDLIDYDFATSRYVQIPGETKRSGVELSATWQATDWLDLGAGYTYTHTREPDGASRPRIPAHDIALLATVRPAERWTVTGVVHAVLDTTDRISPSYGTFEDVPLDDYVLVDAKISYSPTENTELYLRGENLLNQKYEVVKGYGTPGIAIFGGFKARF